MSSEFQFVGDFARMRAKYTAKWGSQIAEMVFQTHSTTFYNKKILLKGNDIIPIVFCLIALNSMVGQQFFLLEYNIFLLTLRANIQQKEKLKI